MLANQSSRLPLLEQGLEGADPDHEQHDAGPVDRDARRARVRRVGQAGWRTALRPPEPSGTLIRKIQCHE